MSNFYSLKVSEIKEQTSEAVAVSFDVPVELYDEFNYKPGQYLTLKFNIEEEEVRRSYSLCSSPFLEEAPTIGVKRVKNGLVSNYINDNLKVGDEVEVMIPNGRFFADVKADNYKTYYLFAAGSGITPILSILKSVLIGEPNSYIHMIYGNTNQETVLFKSELEKLRKEYPTRLILVHSLSKPKTSWFSSKKEFEYRKGRVDSEAINWFINEYPPYAQNTEYFICGPGKMIENTKEALKNIDVPDNRIFIESFGESSTNNNLVGIEKAALKAKLNNQEINISIEKGETVLRALLNNKFNPPYSCEGGVCSSCVCKLKKGKVTMKKNMALSEKEVKEGYILTCQSIALTKEIEVVFE
ncbi:ferredoxin--NADP reductase [Tenacibaculum sp. 190524A05c]|uniref:ferredoxin--NADP reductase n=1 Tax=Tenacibaculum platacis TaxID=3137852 RepID=UPI0031FB8830